MSAPTPDEMMRIAKAWVAEYRFTIPIAHAAHAVAHAAAYAAAEAAADAAAPRGTREWYSVYGEVWR